MSRHRVAVVGGGPSGLMAAEVMAEHGLRVSVYEHKRSAGRKFLLAGRGGLNITHSEPDDAFLQRYGPARESLKAAIEAFGPAELRAWCDGHGETAFVGTSGRVFPKSMRATPLLRSWLRRLAALGVTMCTGHHWRGWTAEQDLLFELGTGETEIVTTDAVVFALGGASWPRVGSDGTWVQHFERAGVAVTDLQPANCGVQTPWSDVLRDRFAGEPLKNVTVSVAGSSVRGDIVITGDGLEGGPVYAHSRALRERLGAGSPATIELDLAPDLDVAALTARLSKRRAKATVSSWLASAGLSNLVVALLREATSNQVPSDPRRVAETIKAMPIPVTGLADIARAISTAGGISFGALDDSFMIRAMPGTFVAGEMLDWEAPTGGYLLQACFSTGVAAANGVLAWLGRTTGPAR